MTEKKINLTAQAMRDAPPPSYHVTWQQLEFEKAMRDRIIEECARVAETALRDDYKSKRGQTRGLSEAEVFIAAAIRALKE